MAKDTSKVLLLKIIIMAMTQMKSLTLPCLHLRQTDIVARKLRVVVEILQLHTVEVGVGHVDRIAIVFKPH